MIETFKDKKILVTGGTGTIGSEIVRQLLAYEPRTIRIFARGEHGHHLLNQEIGNRKDTRFIVGDVRDKDRLRLAMEDIDVVFHAAAKKHVDICEDNPFEAVKTNILGTQNVIDLARDLGVEKVIMISTDKAAHPESVMGVSKLMAEKLILSSYYYQGEKTTKFACVRFGNVLGSRGSVLPVFKSLIQKGEPIRITDPDMTRFVMTVAQAVSLVISASHLTQGQEIFVLKMPAVRIGNLANAVVRHYAPLYDRDPASIKVEVTGSRRGDKFHERLLADHEVEHLFENDSLYMLTPYTPVWGYEYHIKNYPDFKKAESVISSSQHAQKLSEDQIIELIKEVEQKGHVGR